MKKNIAISILVSLIIIGGALFFASGKSQLAKTDEEIPKQNVEIKDGVQYVTVFARGGYHPNLSQIKAGIPTKLIVKTDGTYDCSSSLIVPQVGFKKILKPTGEEVIDLGTPKSRDVIEGVCGMGMYIFQINTL